MNSRFSLYIYLLFIFSVVLFSCSSNSKEPVREPPKTENVYIFGEDSYESDNSDEYDYSNIEESGPGIVDPEEFSQLYYFNDELNDVELELLKHEYITESFSRDTYLITNNSAGFFVINGTIKNINRNYYQWNIFEGFIKAVDGEGAGGCSLYDYNDHEYEYGTGIIMFGTKDCGIYNENDEEQNKQFEKDTTKFLMRSMNAIRWYYNDTIDYISICSEIFKTEEGIGVGSTFEDLQNTYGDLYIHIGWIEDEERVQIRVEKYPMIRFIFTDEDVTFCDKENEDESSTVFEWDNADEIRRKTAIKCFDENGFSGYFKENGSRIKTDAKIWRIVIDPLFITCPKC